MSDFLDNPAGRLHALLTRFAQAGPHPNAIAWDAWIAVLAPGTPPAPAAAFAAVAQLLALPEAIRRAVDALETDDEEKAELVLDLDKIESGFEVMANRGQPVKVMLAPFAPAGIETSAAVRTLRTCSRRLHSEAPEPEVSVEELREFEDAITALMTDVQAAELGVELKLLLLRHLHAMLQAIQFVSVTGVVPLEESLDAFAGALQRQPPGAVLEIVQSSGWERLKGWVEKMDTVLRGARSVHAIAIEGASAVPPAEQLLDRGVHVVEQAAGLFG